MTASVLLVGGGRMGSAMLAGWRETGTEKPETVTVVEPDSACRGSLRSRHGIEVLEDAPASWSGDAIVLAVKPQVLDSLLPTYARFAANTLVLSIAAGKDLPTLSKGLGETAAVVRAMPNTPAAIGRGASVAVAGAGVDETHRQMAERLLSAVGSVRWVEDERLLDAVTALSGSGPAYVFLLVEAMAAAGERQGLDGELAIALAKETVAGAAALMESGSEGPAALRKGVTSSGGTTEAALEVLDGPEGLHGLMARAITAATERSRQLRKPG